MTRIPLKADREEGVAALELALITGVLMVLGFSAVPLYQMIGAYQLVNSADAATLRYATSVTANAHLNMTSNTYSRRPASSDVAAFARSAANDPSLTVTISVCATAGCANPVVVTCPPTGGCSAPGGDGLATSQSGYSVTVSVSKDVDLRLIGAVANAAGSLVGSGDVFPTGTTTQTSTDTGTEE